uniref:Uncharacterized protein n=1 Tax=Arundo donax TaxID=35708 RepID=A0A0A9QAX9_ARUDO
MGSSSRKTKGVEKETDPPLPFKKRKDNCSISRIAPLRLSRRKE